MPAMTEKQRNTVDILTAIGGEQWTKYGKHRVYFNDLGEWLALDGPISKQKATILLKGFLYYDVDDAHWHWGGLSQRDVDTIRSNIDAARAEERAKRKAASMTAAAIPQESPLARTVKDKPDWQVREGYIRTAVQADPEAGARVMYLGKEGASNYTQVIQEATEFYARKLPGTAIARDIYRAELERRGLEVPVVDMATGLPKAAPPKPVVTVKETPTISQRAADARFSNKEAAVRAGRKSRNPELDRQYRAQVVAPAVATDEQGLKRQKAWFKDPSGLDMEGIDTPPIGMEKPRQPRQRKAKPPKARAPRVHRAAPPTAGGLR